MIKGKQEKDIQVEIVGLGQAVSSILVIRYTIFLFFYA